MNKYAANESTRTGVLFGLRRTGKTILLRQWLLHLPYEERNKAAYLTIEGELFSDIKKDLNTLRNNGFKYVVIDEITISEDFIDCCAPLSDNYCASGMKIFITGTDSLSLLFALGEGLYDRDYTLHTTHIPFSEWKRLTGKSIDDYIKWGGLLHLDPTDGEIKHSIPMTLTNSELNDYWAWSADELRTYFTSSISNNLLNYIRNYRDGENAGLLGSLLNKNDMDAAVYGLFGSLSRRDFINRLSNISIIEENYLMSAFQSLILSESHTYSPTIMNRKFKLSDISRTNSAFSNKDEELYDVLKHILKRLRSNAE